MLCLDRFALVKLMPPLARYGATALVALVLAVLNRQQIRKLYGLPNRTPGAPASPVHEAHTAWE